MTPLLTKTIKVSTTQVVFPDVFLKLYQQYHFIRQTQQERNLKFQSSASALNTFLRFMKKLSKTKQFAAWKILFTFFSFSSLPEETEKKSDNYYVDGTVLTDLSKTLNTRYMASYCKTQNHKLILQFMKLFQVILCA